MKKLAFVSPSADASRLLGWGRRTEECRRLRMLRVIAQLKSLTRMLYGLSVKHTNSTPKGYRKRTKMSQNMCGENKQNKFYLIVFLFRRFIHFLFNPTGMKTCRTTISPNSSPSRTRFGFELAQSCSDISHSEGAKRIPNVTQLNCRSDDEEELPACLAARHSPRILNRTVSCRSIYNATIFTWG